MQNFKNIVLKNKWFVTFISVVFVIIMCWIIYKIIKKLFYKKAHSMYVLSGVKDAREPEKKSMSAELHGNTIGLEYTISAWLYIEDWNYNYGKFKHVLHVGYPGAFSPSPGIWLHPTKPSLIIHHNTNGLAAGNLNPNNLGSTITPGHDATIEDVNTESFANPSNKTFKKSLEGFYAEEEVPDLLDSNINTEIAMCNVSDIKVQRWIHLGVVLQNKTLDVYINGRLRKSCTFDFVPRVPKDANRHMFINQNGGYHGIISDVYYNNRALSAVGINSLYNKGHTRIDVDGYFANFAPPSFKAMQYSLNKCMGTEGADGMKDMLTRLSQKIQGTESADGDTTADATTSTAGAGTTTTTTLTTDTAALPGVPGGAETYMNYQRV